MPAERVTMRHAREIIRLKFSRAYPTVFVMKPHADVFVAVIGDSAAYGGTRA